MTRLALLLGVETVLYAATMALVARDRTRGAGEYAGTLFHLLLLPVVAVLSAAAAGQAAGYLWVVCDVIASTGLIWTQGAKGDAEAQVFGAVRMAGHLFAGIWIGSVSVRLGVPVRTIGFVLAATLAGYTLAGGRLPEKALAVPSVLMLIWLPSLAYHVHSAAAAG